MTEQALAAQGWEPYQWTRGGFLEPALLKSLHDINHRWLEILARPLWSDDSRDPLDRIALEMAQAGPASRAALARCPFALFGARFHDGGYWMRISDQYCVHDRAAPRNASPKCERRTVLAGFAQVALFFGWHLLHLNPVAARLLLGIADPVAAILKELSPVRLQQLAEAHPQMLVPRWAERPLFWQVLLNAAERGETHFAQVRLLGIQMVAADLMPSLPPSPASPGRA